MLVLSGRGFDGWCVVNEIARGFAVVRDGHLQLQLSARSLDARVPLLLQPLFELRGGDAGLEGVPGGIGTKAPSHL
jgi:hypothetical protein